MAEALIEALLLQQRKQFDRELWELLRYCEDLGDSTSKTARDLQQLYPILRKKETHRVYWVLAGESWM